MVLPVDLTDASAQTELRKALEPVDVVVHAAAQLAGDDAEQAKTTLAATKTVLSAMVSREGAAPRLVLVSSFSVYGLGQMPDRATVDEKTPVEKKASGGDDD